MCTEERSFGNVSRSEGSEESVPEACSLNCGSLTPRTREVSQPDIVRTVVLILSSDMVTQRGALRTTLEVHAIFYWLVGFYLLKMMMVLLLLLLISRQGLTMPG